MLSVGGGDLERGVSVELVQAVEYARSVGAAILGIVGREGGHTARVGDHVVVIPTVNPALVTPISEAFQAVVWHGMVTHPDLAAAPIRPDALRAGATGRPPNAPAPRPHPRRPGRCRDGRNVPPAAPIPATRHSDPAIPAFTTTAKPVPRDLRRDGDATDSHAPFSRGKDGPVHESRRKALRRCTYT